MSEVVQNAEQIVAVLTGEVPGRRGTDESGIDAAEPTTAHRPMRWRETLGPLAAALALGVAGDVLLRAGAVAINVTLLVALALALLAGLVRQQGRAITVGAVGLGVLAMSLAAALAWRAAVPLVLLNLAALATVGCALAAVVRYGAALPLESAGPGAYLWGALSTGFVAATGAPALARPALATVRGRGQTLTASLGVALRGAALALPALVVFGALLASADGTLERWGNAIGDWDPSSALGHVLLTSVLAWGAAGALYTALRPAPDARGDAPTDGGRSLRAPGGFGVSVALHAPTLRAADWIVALALVDLLFVVFAVLQLGWLVGGRALVSTGAVSYAEYARRGFFQLVVVAALALPLAVGAYAAGVRALARSDAAHPERTRRRLRTLAGTLLACVGVVLLSAADRMRLYQDAYGLTELRFYASAFMGWLAIVGACAATTILRDRPAPFALGTLVTGWAWVLALDVSNPDARIVGVNATRAAAGRAFDVEYLASLSADATPGLLDLLVRTRPTAASATPTNTAYDASCALLWQVDGVQRAEAARADWRSWHLARSRAAARVGAADRAGALTAWRASCPATRPDPH